jgi:hypothetical protein
LSALYTLGLFQLPAGVPLSFFLVIVCAVALWFFLNRTNMGRHIFAIGGNPQAARVSGIDVDRVLVYVYAICGFFAGLSPSYRPRRGSSLEAAAILSVAARFPSPPQVGRRQEEAELPLRAPDGLAPACNSPTGSPGNRCNREPSCKFAADSAGCRQ